MYKFFRPFLFRLDPETAHQFTLQLMRMGGIEPIHTILRSIYSAPPKPVQAFGLTFKNPVGLAAGYDKDAAAIRGLSALGFGHVEVGTVTPRPQPGNPPPRVFRLPEDEAVINRMGFPGKGAGFVVDRLKLLNDQSFHRSKIVLGLNLGKNKDTPLEEAARDYLELMRRLMSYADYLAINVSSPNTVGLRRLQGRGMLENLLGRINLERGSWETRLPILVKIAPDLTDEELDDAIGVILDKGMDGIIATNTTLRRDGLRSRHRGESGGLSGSPLRARSEAVLHQVAKRVNGKVPIVSAGGIMSPEDAMKRLAMGASLVQVYTGLVYRGPKLVQEIVKKI
jgi:dihydroorotate dehydrogenase